MILVAHHFIGLLSQIQMAPGMVSHFVAVLCDFRGTVGMLMHEFSGDKERAGGMRIREGRN